MQTPSSLNELVASEARAEIARQRKTVGQLAAHLRSSDRTASRLLNAQRPIDLRQLEGIADFLGVDVLEFQRRAVGSTAA